MCADTSFEPRLALMDEGARAGRDHVADGVVAFYQRASLTHSLLTQFSSVPSRK
jgi:hypothetical protein